MSKRWWVAIGIVALVVGLVGVAIAKSQQTTPKESAADFYADVPQGEDAWFKVDEACGFEPGTTLVDYQPGADLSGAYEYEDANGNRGTAIVSLNGYGAIVWVDTCRYLPGVPVSYSERKRVDWGR